jgi:hypothetical protein
MKNGILLQPWSPCEASDVGHGSIECRAVDSGSGNLTYQV